MGRPETIEGYGLSFRGKKMHLYPNTQILIYNFIHLQIPVKRLKRLVLWTRGGTQGKKKGETLKFFLKPNL